eukprot:1185309-Prorocentrum_minimum.AAC.6
MAAAAAVMLFPTHLRRWSAAAKRSLPAVAGKIRVEAQGRLPLTVRCTVTVLHTTVLCDTGGVPSAKSPICVVRPVSSVSRVTLDPYGGLSLTPSALRLARGAAYADLRVPLLPRPLCVTLWCYDREADIKGAPPHSEIALLGSSV